MEMDFPGSEELEWLESSSHLQEEYYHRGLEEEKVEEEKQAQGQSEGGVELDLNPYPRLGQLAEWARSTVSIVSGAALDHMGCKKRPRSDPNQDEEEEEPSEISSKRSSAVAEAGQNNGRRCSSFNSVVTEEDDTFLSRYALEIDGDCIPVTGPCGQRVYAKIIRAEKGATFPTPLKKRDGFISEPINTLFQRAEQNAFMKALQESSVVHHDMITPEASIANKELWVNKYSPKSFTELLSDEQTNREVLLWLKQWDSTVFGSDIKSTAEDVLSALRRYSSISHHQKHTNMNFLKKNKVARSSENYLGRLTSLEGESIGLKGTQGLQNRRPRGTSPPDQKVLLLSGPPGLGKTTLAHVAAKHCGYHVVEINASDDRSSSIVERKILDAVQMNSVMSNSKPSCLVIDEIDGALGDGKGVVDVILKMVAADRNPDLGAANYVKEEQLGKKSLRRGCKVAPPSRPVICICNDLYAPVLRPLRQVAKVHIFGQPTVNRVVSRLKYICSKEGLRTSSSSLTALAECAECDIRSCLNTLQFLNKSKESLNALDVSSQIIGQKDATRNAFDIWKEIFQKRKMKGHRKSNTIQTAAQDSLGSLYSLLSNLGDCELIFDGIHENILQLQYHDPLMWKTVQCLDTLAVSDLLHQSVMRSHNMPLYAYLPTTAILIHHLLGQVEKPMIEWPKAFQRYRVRLMERMEILRSWISNIPPYISRHLSINSFVEDTVSPLLYILSPPTVRPVALHLLSEIEKNDLAQLVSTMVAYSITYKKTRYDPLTNEPRHETMADASPLSFDPPIKELAGFKGYRLSHCELTAAMKQVLIHEVEKQKILQGRTGRLMHQSDSNKKENKADDAVVLKENNPAKIGCTSACTVHNVKRARTNHECSISKSPSTFCSGGNSATFVSLKTPGIMKKPSNGSLSFFDRFKKLDGQSTQNAGSPMHKPATLERDSRPLLFKFNEGFTNAVKRPVRIREFLIK
ncbi:hypothetical protein Ancab_031307 [Ancistrocladus abbreviatus]